MLDLECIDCGRPSNTYLCPTCTSIAKEEILGMDFPPESLELKGASLKRFILGGNALFTLHNSAKGTHLTYKVRVAKDNPELFFVSVLTGPSNEEDFSYLGILRGGVYWHGKKSKISKDAPSAKTFTWFWSNLTRLPQALKVLHHGRCGRCGRTLTVPESIASGFGEECMRIMGL